MAASLFSRRKAPFVYVPHSAAAQTRILDLVARGELTPVTEAVHDITQLRAAFTDLTRNERFGKIVISC
ncbi:zinc-binding dehydrogenase [Streptomyces acidiscabies]|uniref:zinc-binding dehydrogenase n=1 Tax=Streptomyces acidiscabies TaxID=42234 RepID=UPI0038F7A113